MRGILDTTRDEVTERLQENRAAETHARRAWLLRQTIPRKLRDAEVKKWADRAQEIKANIEAEVFGLEEEAV